MMRTDIDVLNFININKLVTVGQLKGSLGMSESTVRRSLCRLSQKKRIIRFRGGASTVYAAETYSKIHERYGANIAKKEKIAKKASEMVKYGSNVILLGGTTVACMCKHLTNMGLTVITNSTLVLDQLKYDKNTKLILLGGEYDNDEAEMHGWLTGNMLAYLNADYLFTSATAFDPGIGFSTPDLDAIELYKKCFASSQNVCMLIDSSKYQRKDIAVMAHNEDVDYLISDSELPKEARERFASIGISVVIAD